MDSFIIAALALCSLTAPTHGDKGTSKARSCSDIRQFYLGKGFSLDGVPQSEISGYFLELLNTSEMNLQETFTQSLGVMYSQNVQLFSDLYIELRHYYQGSNVNLEEVLNDFWSRLLEKLFYYTNKQYSIGEDYLDCMSKQLETLRPFGDTPRELKLKVTRTFVAARSFVRALVVSGEVVWKVSQLPLSQECTRAMMKMTYCPHCRAMASARPCANYCSNVMKGCLANQADLNTEWRHLADTMIQVADRFDGPSGVDVVVLSLPHRILEAISTMADNMATVNNKLMQACGNLREGGTSTMGQEDIINRGKVTVEDKLGPNTNKLEQLVSDVSRILRDMQPYWVSIPSVICSDRVATGTGAKDKCWNGMNRARYLPEVMSDGLASQINNPEVEVDITKPDIAIRQHIMQLKIMTHRLRNALNGNDVDFQDSSDDSSGSGSGMCADEMCSRSPRLSLPSTDGPNLDASVPENKKVKSAANGSFPCLVIYPLSLVTLLLWR